MVDEERDRDTNDHPTEQPETQRQRVGEHGDNRCRDRPGERRPLAAEGDEQRHEGEGAGEFEPPTGGDGRRREDADQGGHLPDDPVGERPAGVIGNLVRMVRLLLEQGREAYEHDVADDVAEPQATPRRQVREVWAQQCRVHHEPKVDDDRRERHEPKGG